MPGRVPRPCGRPDRAPDRRIALLCPHARCCGQCVERASPAPPTSGNPAAGLRRGSSPSTIRRLRAQGPSPPGPVRALRPRPARRRRRSQDYDAVATTPGHRMRRSRAAERPDERQECCARVRDGTPIPDAAEPGEADRAFRGRVPRGRQTPPHQPGRNRRRRHPPEVLPRATASAVIRKRAKTPPRARTADSARRGRRAPTSRRQAQEQRPGRCQPGRCQGCRQCPPGAGPARRTPMPAHIDPGQRAVPGEQAPMSLQQTLGHVRVPHHDRRRHQLRPQPGRRQQSATKRAAPHPASPQRREEQCLHHQPTVDHRAHAAISASWGTARAAASVSPRAESVRYDRGVLTASRSSR